MEDDLGVTSSAPGASTAAASLRREEQLGLGCCPDFTLEPLVAAGVTVEDLARAWASIDGKRDHFDAGKNISVMEDETGHYAGYMCEAEEAVVRALKYARSRLQPAAAVEAPISAEAVKS